MKKEKEKKDVKTKEKREKGQKSRGGIKKNKGKNVNVNEAEIVIEVRETVRKNIKIPPIITGSWNSFTRIRPNEQSWWWVGQNFLHMSGPSNQHPFVFLKC